MSEKDARAETGASYDAAEIRARMAVCFSTPDLRQLCQEMAVPDIPWERGINEAARAVVRHFERNDNLSALVTKLREARPLVEWPEPVFEVQPEQPPEEQPPEEGVHDRITAPGIDELAQASVHDRATTPDAGELADLLEPEVDQPDAVAPPSSAGLRLGAMPPAIKEHAQPEPHISDPYADKPPSTAWPGMAEQPAPASRGIDPRILIAVAALMLLAVIIAFVAGRASTPQTALPSPATSASAATPSGAASNALPAPRSTGVAARAVNAITARLQSVARTCEIEPGAAVDLMQRAYQQCGTKTAAPAQTPSLPLSAPPDNAQSQPPVQQPVVNPDKPRPAFGNAPQAPAVAENAGCMKACDRQHQSCKSSKCGKEPTQGSKYEQYQLCLSGCLREASKCRLACQ